MVTHERKVTSTTKIILYGNAAGRCCICNRVLTSFEEEELNPTNVGEVAHIVPLDEEDDRYDPNYPVNKLNDYDNLILVCSNCHKDIDKRQLYSVDELQKIKKEHQKKVNFRLQEEMTDISYKELKIICEFVIENDIDIDEDLFVIPIQEKINKNKLSRVIPKIQLGLSQVPLVKQYIISIGQFDQGFVRRLRNNFIYKYKEGLAIGLQADDLFDYLVEFACQSHIEDNYKAASIAVLVYFFEACDVFEK